MSEYTAIDVFAGCGGLSLGLHLAGWEMQFAIEKDPMAFETLEANFFSPSAPYLSFGKWPAWLDRKPMNIEDVLGSTHLQAHLKSLRGKIDLVCGGPPCQGFSVGGIRDGNDQRNLLPLRYIDFVHLVHPRAVLIENVEGMARKFESKPGEKPYSFTDWLIAKLNEEGYNANYQIIDASRFGVPQIRKRVIIFGIAKDFDKQSTLVDAFFELLSNSSRRFTEKKGLGAGRQITVWEAIEDLNGKRRVICPDSPKFMAGRYKTARSAYAKLMRCGIPNDQIPDSHRFSYHGEAILNFYNIVHATQTYGRLPKSFLLECGTKKDKKVFIDPNAPASTITTHPDEFIHYDQPRNISVREMARLQSFPDNFVFRGRYTINGPRRRFDTARCSQVGNAVPPLLSEAIGLCLLQIISSSHHLFDRDKPHRTNLSTQRLLPLVAIPS